MRLTSKTAYGVQAMFDLAFHGRGRAVQARETAERQGVPLRYLEQILQDLRRAGLVEGKRGPGGGYLLARPATEVRLSDVVAVLDGPVEEILSWEEPAEGKRKPRPTGENTDVPALVWRELAGQVAGLFGGVTLQDLVVRAETLGVARANGAPQMYFI
jgi:Rrf2 family transcriptional regulator, iron-sulfur cluster assembly transcription factor